MCSVRGTLRHLLGSSRKFGGGRCHTWCANQMEKSYALEEGMFH
jgi:hypothetical protein